MELRLSVAFMVVAGTYCYFDLVNLNDAQWVLVKSDRGDPDRIINNVLRPMRQLSERQLNPMETPAVCGVRFSIGRPAQSDNACLTDVKRHGLHVVAGLRHLLRTGRSLVGLSYLDSLDGS
jgi:hypothetical protein